jgi:hypothetical protein
VPTVKLVSTMEEPSRGSKATEKPSPSMSTGSGTSSLHAYLHTCCGAGHTTVCQLRLSACRCLLVGRSMLISLPPVLNC